MQVGEVLDVVQEHAVPADQSVDRAAREVAEVLVVDRVELGVFDEVADVGVLHRHDAVVGQEDGHALDEAVEIGDVGHHVVGDDHVGGPPFVAELLRQLGAEELGERGHSDLLGGLRLPRRGIDAEHRNPLLDEVAQEVAVVAGHLDDEAVTGEVPPLDQVERVASCVLEQVVGERREVEVIVDEQLLRRNVLEDLHERARPAERDLQGEARLGFVSRGRLHECVGQRGRPEVEEGLQPWRTTRAAPRRICRSHVASRRRSRSLVSRGTRRPPPLP